MNIPFITQKSNSALWISGAAVGIVAAGALIWRYFKNKGSEVVKEHLDAPYHKQPDKKKKQRTDVHELHAIVPGGLGTA